MTIQNTRDLARAYRHGPHAWPGGYPAYLHMADGETLCWTCFRSEYGLIAQAARDQDDTGGWRPAALDVLWETTDGPDHCDHCSAELESAYGTTATDPGTPLNEETTA